MLLFEQGTTSPTAPAAAPYTWHRRVKIVEGTTAASVETAINTFYNDLESLPAYRFGAAVLSVVMLSDTSPFRAILQYGYFTTP